jgi:hypothetical protein
VDHRITFRWRTHGMVPRLEQVAADLWSGVLTQFVVIDEHTRRSAGLVVAYRPDTRSGTVRLVAVAIPDFQQKRVALEAPCLFINHLFVTRPLRKIYVELPDYNLSLFGSGPLRDWKQEASLPNDLYYAGRYWFG